MELNRKHWVYLIGAMESEYEVRAIKIGITSGGNGRPAGRARELQTGSFLPLELLSAKKFDRRQEAGWFESAAHRRFKADRISGEWFHPSLQLRKWIEENFIDHFRLCDLDRYCMSLWDDPDSEHYLDEITSTCPCGYEPRSWGVA